MTTLKEGIHYIYLMMFRDMSAFVVVEQKIRLYENAIKETYHSPSCATHDLLGND